MPRPLLALLLVLLPIDPAQSAVLRWNALPALDVRQSQGPYAGQTICPMCRHGYDAGVLVLLPAKAPAEAAGATLDALRSATHGVDDPRFRVFVVLLEPPGRALQDRLETLPPTWFVGTLLEKEGAVAREAFGEALVSRGTAHVFAQRRSLRRFDLLQAIAADELAADVRWAREVLDYAYADPAASDHPDTPKGLLWAAPSRLEGRVSSSQDAAVAELCFDTGVEHGASEALVGLRPAAPTSRTQWARTDARGCVELEPHAGRIEVELFAWRARPLVTELAAAAPGQTSLRTRVSPLQATGVDGGEPLVGGRCDGCEAVFTGLPARLPTVARLVADDTRGEPLRIRGRVLDVHGNPRPGVVVYAYQTDATGHYPPAPELAGAAARHGRLRGWALSDALGRYGFDTVRPASYPASTVEQHVHMHVIEPGRCTYYLGDLLFDDDPKLSAHQRARAERAHGGSGVVRPGGDAGGWQADRDIRLGLHVSGHQACGDRATPSLPAPAPSARPPHASR